MNIPQSAIQPFGIGMPTIHFGAREHQLEICDAINLYAKHITKHRPDMPTDGINQQVVYLVGGRGVKATCHLSKMGNNNRRIFILCFDAPWYPHEVSFGFGIGAHAA